MADQIPAVPMIDSTGKVVPVPADQAEAASANLGYAAASPKQVEDFQAEQERAAKGVEFGEEAKAAAAAFARVTTSSVSDYAATALVDNEGNQLIPGERLRQLEEEHPVGTGIGTAIGVVVPALLTGGESAVAAGAERGLLRGAAEFAAPSVISRVGRGVEGLVAGALPKAESVAGKMAVSALSKGFGAATEGVLYGAGQVVSESALGDPNLTAESALSEIGLSAALGGGLGGLVGASEIGLPAAIGKVKGALERLAGKGEEVAESGLKTLWESQGVARDTSSMLLDRKADVAELEKVFPGVARSLPYQTQETAEKILSEWPKAVTDPNVRNEMTKTLTSGVEDMVTKVESAYKEANSTYIPKARQQLLKQWDSDNPHYGFKWAQDEATRLRGKIDSVLEEMESGKYRSTYDQGYSGTLRKIRDGFAERVGEDAHPMDVFEQIYKTRQMLDDEIPYMKLRGDTPVTIRNAVNKVRDIRTELADSLRSEKVWGEAGAVYGGLKDAESSYIQAKKALFGENTKAFDYKTTKLLQQTDKGITAIPTRAETWINQMGQAKGDAINEVLGEYQQRSKVLLEQLERHHVKAPVVDFDREGLESLLNKTGEQISQTRQQATISNTIRQLEKSPDAGFPGRVPLAGASGTSEGSSIMGGLGLAGAGRSIAGITKELGVGSALGPIATAYGLAKAGYHAFQSLKQVSKTVATLSRLEAAGLAVSRKIDAGVSLLVRGGDRAALVVRGEAAAGLAGGFGRTPVEARRQYEKRRDRIASLAGNIDAMHDALSRQGAALQEHAPDTSQAMQLASSRAVSFLASKLPQTQDAPLGPKRTPGHSEVATFNRYYEAANHPTSILKQAAAGTLTSEGVEAVKTVYPTLYAKMQRQVLETLARRNPEKIPYQTRQAISRILGQDVDGSVALFSANQQAYAKGGGPAPAGQVGAAPAGGRSHQLKSDAPRRLTTEGQDLGRWRKERT